MRGNTGGGPSIGRGFPVVISTRYKLNKRSSTETEIVAVDDCMPVLLWTKHLLNAQGYYVLGKCFYQDNKSATILENNSKASSRKHAKHINNRYYFLK